MQLTSYLVNVSTTGSRLQLRSGSQNTWIPENGSFHSIHTMKAAQKLYEKFEYFRNPSRDWIRNNGQFLVYEKNI